MFGLYRLALVSPDLRPADVDFNVEQMISSYREAAAAGASLVLFPEAAVTGSSCGSLLGQPYLLQKSLHGAARLAAATGNAPAVFGLALHRNGAVFNAAAVAQNGEIAAFVVQDLPEELCDGDLYPAATVFECGVDISVGFYGDFPQDNHAAVRLYVGAETAEPLGYRKRDEFFRSLSAAGACVAAGAFAGIGETTTDNIYSGGCCCAVNGETVCSGKAGFAPQIRYCDFDSEKILAARLQQQKFAVPELTLDPMPEAPDMRYFVNRGQPFLPADPAAKMEFCAETLAIQSQALAARFARCHAQSMVISISGGLDSTLALVAMAQCCKEHNIAPEKIIAVTMPGFGTTGRTRNNALKLAELIGATIREIPIVPACRQHFADIGHDENCRNSVYENSQARERTQILMDIANQTGGIVIGTGDLSEIALGWSTFNGDQMAMYNLNCSIPKTSIAPLLECAARDLPAEAAAVLHDVIATPVSPELLPPDENGDVGQKTEAILGAYELHDYYLWQLLNGVAEAEKLLALAQHAFGEKYPEAELIRVRDLFMRRFFTQQFKRTAAPDGIQAGQYSLSARGAWQMPSDLQITKL